MLDVSLIEALFARLAPVYDRVRCFACDLAELREPSELDPWLGALEGERWVGSAPLYFTSRSASIDPATGAVEILRARPAESSAIELPSSLREQALAVSAASKASLSLGGLSVAVMGLGTVLLARLEPEPLRWVDELEIDPWPFCAALGAPRPLIVPKKKRGAGPAQGELALGDQGS